MTDIKITNKKKYREFCKKEKYIPLFSQAWWLDAVCDEGYWDVALVEKDNKIIASMPYYIKKKNIFTAITLPKLTQTMGPYIKYPKGQKYTASLSWDKKIMNELIEQLPKVDMFTQSFNYSIKNTLPFYWNGYNISIGYTYTLDNLMDMEKLFSNFSRSTRKEIKNAKKNGIEVVDSDDIETFYEINKITYKKQGVKIPYSLDFLKNLYRQGKEQDAVVMKFALKDDIVYSVGLYFYDNQSLYAIMGSSNRDIKLYGSEYLLDWEMIEFASKKNLIFDFEGSMIERIESRMRSFGTIQKRYSIVTKNNSKLLGTIKYILDN